MGSLTLISLSLLVLTLSSIISATNKQQATTTTKVQFDTSLPTQFNIIGPFAIGEREECYDTLEAYGGIWNIPIGDSTLYPSELGNNGRVGWITYQATTAGVVSLDWSQTISWDFLQSVWGWNIWLWYGYAIGEMQVSAQGTYMVSCSGARDYFIRDTVTGVILEFVGDYYGYGTGAQTFTLPRAGTYQFVVRMFSSVRLNQSPLGSFSCSLQAVQPSISFITGDSLMPDIVDGNLASPYATVTVINTGSTVLTDLTAIVRLPTHLQATATTTQVLPSLQAYPSQKVAIPVAISVESLIPVEQCPLTANVDVLSGNNIIGSTSVTFNCTTFPNPYLYTFVDYDNTVQYAVTNPPSNCNGQMCGVMLATHGAGVEASSQFWMDALPRQTNLFIVYPTGRRSWGYDWESASRLNVFSAINYLAQHLPGIPAHSKDEYLVDPTKILFVGHSMGGHGCWSLLSHFGDLAMGGACAAGFVKLQFYVFMNTKPGYSYVDPVLQGILMASIAENDNDMYTTNLAGLPLMARYGQNDTNVNPWHSRRMARMTAEANGNASSIIISEVPNEGHWFDGILGDNYMQQFYNSIIGGASLTHPPIPKTITITSNNPSSSGQRANLVIMQLTTPFRVGRIQLTQVPQSSGGMLWIVATQNVRRFGLSSTPLRDVMPTQIMVDGQMFDAAYLPSHFLAPDKYGVYWNITDDITWPQTERSAPTYGPMRQIFEKQFTIVVGTNVTAEDQLILNWAAVFITSFWNTYGRGSAQIITDSQFVPSTNCSSPMDNSFILLGGPSQNAITNKFSSQIPVQYNSDTSFSVGPAEYADPDQGVATLAPNQCGTGLLLVVSGNSMTGFVKAIKTIPQRSGVVVPDYMVVGSEWGYKGAGGIVAAGFWSNQWQFSTDSSYQALNFNSNWQ
ncbi:hypothetical protein SAMD00019534_014420 [Acytostelium subglobosum LB1]|uniref:hypothetical protein n=1 Tax=Acytostelium subglobosum LB1 TaxID=1410327 RepID=UPI000644B6F2|nr:hypothetical protein SAMD00019534_014420 [Acytostelium subglobosum LB1]GAM18267.1 hypothetical protein SAMD00019534_014420 [Acytostelium subglobosum LB1]|eukprot:XP_012758863.1 hypothetical protein SAMD00019534_014420 [Acytostelium subglobosum LB1]